MNAANNAPGVLAAGNNPTPVTPVDFTFPRRRHESVSIAGTVGGIGETSGVTYGGRRIAQAIILDGLENASQEVFAVILEVGQPLMMTILDPMEPRKSNCLTFGYFVLL